MPLIYLYLITVPVIIILIYLYVRDKFNREPIWLLLLTFLGGCFSVVPVLITGEFTELLVPHLRGIARPLYTAFLQAGFVEEFFKFVIVLLIVWWSKHFDEKFDGIIFPSNSWFSTTNGSPSYKSGSNRGYLLLPYK